MGRTTAKVTSHSQSGVKSCCCLDATAGGTSAPDAAASGRWMRNPPLASAPFLVPDSAFWYLQVTSRSQLSWLQGRLSAFRWEVVLPTHQDLHGSVSEPRKEIRCWAAPQTKSVHYSSHLVKICLHPLPSPCLKLQMRCWVLEGRMAFLMTSPVLTPTNWIPVEWNTAGGSRGFGWLGQEWGPRLLCCPALCFPT